MPFLGCTTAAKLNWQRQFTTSIDFQARSLHPMTSATDRILRGFFVLGMVFLTAVIGYRFIFELDWMQATWMSVISISTTGFAEESVKPASFQLFTIFIVVLGVFSTAYAFTGLVQLLLAGELERTMGKRKMERDINKLQRHVIVCGYGRLGHSLTTDLADEGQNLVIIESGKQKAEQAEADGYMVLEGDATEEDVLKQAGIERAKSLVTTLPSDAANVFITLTAHDLNAKVQIIARAELPSTETKLRRAGATKVVMPAANSAKHMVRMITRPSTAHLIDLMGERTFLDFEMDELVISPNSKLVGLTVGKSEVNYKHKLLVVAVKQSDESMVFNPGGAYEFKSNDIAIVMGKRRDIEGFISLHELTA